MMKKNDYHIYEAYAATNNSSKEGRWVRNENAIKFHKSDINALSKFANIHHIISHAMKNEWKTIHITCCMMLLDILTQNPLVLFFISIACKKANRFLVAVMNELIFNGHPQTHTHTIMKYITQNLPHSFMQSIKINKWM